MSELFPDRPTTTPIGSAVEQLGSSGEGFDLTAAAGKDQQPTLSAGGWWDFGKADRFGAGGAVQKTKAAWAAIAKFTWRPGKK
jgi:hypothetical protein